MDSLLQRGRRFSDGLLGVLEGLGTARVTGDPDLEAAAGDAQTRIAREQAKRAGLMAMMEPGMPWYAMTTARDAAGSQAYGNHLLGAANVAEELRKRRDADARRARISELIKQAGGWVDAQGAPRLSEAQLGVLGALDPDSQSQVLLNEFFPKASRSGVATAGAIEKVFRGPNGNAWAVVQTGDPARAAETIDTGTPMPQDIPSEVLFRSALMQNPALIDINARDKRTEVEEQEKGKANIAAKLAIPGILQQTISAVDQMTRVRDTIAGLPTGPIQGALLAKFNADMQVAVAMIREQTMLKIAELKQLGASLQPITERELQFLSEMGPLESNLPEANVRILNEAIQRGQRAIQRMEAQLLMLDEGGEITDWRPDSSKVMPAGGGGGQSAPQPVPPAERRIPGL